ncbi:MAG: hypothetical protein HRT87_01220 [Legionellales bacterium]|nr:hypothetical protein [Legionellales bacterium]
MSDKQIIKDFSEALLKDMRKAIPSATGKTADSLELNIDKDGLGFQILGGQQIGALINGRKPTKKGAKTKSGDETLQEQIYKWIKARSIQPRESGISQLSLSWGISKAIHRDGYKGKGNIFRSVITNNRINSITKTLLDSQSTTISSQVIKEFKF